MTTATTPQAGFKLTPGDIVFTIFRHLKKIIIFGVLGVACGAGIFLLWPTQFQSNARLMIKYVTTDRGIIDTERDTQTVTFGARGTDYIISAEQSIVTSLDIAKEVADEVGPGKILGDSEEAPTTIGAAIQILGNLDVENPRGTNMLLLSVRHKDAETTTQILNVLIETYLRKHLEIHRKSDAFENFITRETDQMRMRLQQTEEELHTQYNLANVISIPEAKSRISSDVIRIRQYLLETQTLLAELNSSIIQEEVQLAPAQESKNAEANAAEVTQTQPKADLTAALSQFNYLQQRLELFREQERSLSLRYTPENSQIKNVKKQAEETNAKLIAFVSEHPELQPSEIATTTNLATGNPNSAGTIAKLQSDKIRKVALEARYKVLLEQLAELRAEASSIDEVELTVNELNRRKALQESKYRSLLESMEKSRVQEELGDGRVNNIGVIQSPSPAFVAGNKRNAFAFGAAAGISMIGLVWAFLVDLFLDRTIKRPTEIRRNLSIPLFMSLPDLSDKKFKKIDSNASKALLLQAGKLRQQKAIGKKNGYAPKSTTLQAAALNNPSEYGAGEETNVEVIQPWNEQHALNEHFEALRDKVITYFESRNLTHKPKLIAMTGLGTKSGVTTIASGLAGSISKTGEGNVLLVDMTLGHETAQQFYHGKSVMNLDEVLESSAGAKMGNNLYVVAEGTGGVKLPRVLPQRFNKIIPKLKASDFDYIIFDMPPVSPISSTPRLASFMDVVLLVMEAEKTNRDTANQALELLAESKAHLGGILNKTKSHVPKRLEQDLLSQS